jgi:hypothetical protein
MKTRYPLPSAIIVAVISMLLAPDKVTAQSCSLPTFTVTGSYSFGGGGTPPSCWHQQVFYLAVSPQVSDPDCGVWVDWEFSTDGVNYGELCCGSSWGKGVGSVEVPTWFRPKVVCFCSGNLTEELLEPQLVLPTLLPTVSADAEIVFGEVSLCEGPVTIIVDLPDWADEHITVLGYQWHRFNAPIPGETGAALTLTEPGFYHPTMTYLDHNGQQCEHTFIESINALTDGCSCLSATEVQCGTTVTDNNSSALDENLSQYPVCTSGADNNAVWYKLTPPTSGIVTVSTCGSQFYSRVRVYEGPCPGLTSCTFNQDYCSFNGFFNGVVNFNAVGGQTYHILLTGAFSGSAGDYTMTITCPSACTGEPVGGTAQSSQQSVCGSGTFNLSLTGQSQHAGQTYQWQRSQNGTTWQDISGATSATYTASQSSAHHYRCVVTCGSSANSASVLVGHSGPCPANDCTQAIPVSCGTDHVGNTTGQENADLTGAPFCGSGGSTTRGVWHAYTALADGQATFSTCNQETGFDTYMRVYEGCGQGTQSDEDMDCLGSNDDAPGCGLSSEVTVNVTAGQTYMVLVTGFGSQNHGNYTLTSECPVPSCTGNPNAGHATSTVLLPCPNQPFTLSIFDFAFIPEQTYQWQSSTDGANWVDIIGANQSQFTTSQTESHQYRCVVVCGAQSSISSPVAVDVPEAPVISAPEGFSFCLPDGSVSLVADPPGADYYEWENPIGTVAYQTVSNVLDDVNEPGFWRVGAVYEECIRYSQSVTLTALPAPDNGVLLDGTQICEGQTTSMTSTASGGVSYQWFVIIEDGDVEPLAGATGQTYVTANGGTFFVRVTNSDGCVSQSEDIIITLLPAPTVTISGGTDPNSTLTATPGYSLYDWFLNGEPFTTTAINSIVASETGVYTVSVTDANECVGTSGPHDVFITCPEGFANLTPIATVSNTQPCPATDIILSMDMPQNDNLSYQWQVSHDNGISFTDIPEAAAHTATVVIYLNSVYRCLISCGGVTVETTFIAVNPPGPPGLDGVVCFPAGNLYHMINASPQGAESYSWFLDGEFLFSTPAHSIEVEAPGTYSVVVTFGECELTAEHTVLPAPEISITPIYSEVCSGEMVTLSAIPSDLTNYIWRWSETVDNPNYNFVLGVSSSTYDATTFTAGSLFKVSGQHANGCYSRLSEPAAVIQLPAPTPVIVQTGDVLSVTEPFITYQWFFEGVEIPGAMLPTYTATQDGMYSVEVTDELGCAGMGHYPIGFCEGEPVAGTVTTNHSSYCPYNTVQLSQSGTSQLPGQSYQWQISANGQDWEDVFGQVFFNFNGLYFPDTPWYRCIVKCGEASDTTQPKHLEPLHVNYVLSPAMSAICPGSSEVLLTVSHGAAYQWFRDGVEIFNNTNQYVAGIEGTYQVRVTSEEGCVFETNTAEVQPLFPVDPTVNPTELAFCPEEDVTGTLTAINGSFEDFFIWYNGATIVSAGTGFTSINIASTGSYWVEITKPEGCKSTSPFIPVTIRNSPDATVTPSSLAICANDAGGLLSGPDGMEEYSWQPGGPFTQDFFAPPVADVYTLTVTDVHGCQKTSAPVPVTVNPAPEVVVSPSTIALCPDEQGTFSGPAGMSAYEWIPNGETTQAINVTLPPDSYVLFATDANGCTGVSQEVFVTPADGPQPTISLSGGMLVTQSGMASYQWFLNGVPIFPGNAATQNIVGDGAYTVTVTDANGCEGTSEPFTYVGIDGVDGRPAITLHPNPASDLLRISGLQGTAVAEVMDMAGRLVMTTGTDDRHGIAIGQLASGSYLLRITEEGRSAVTLRFVRE